MQCGYNAAGPFIKYSGYNIDFMQKNSGNDFDREKNPFYSNKSCIQKMIDLERLLKRCQTFNSMPNCKHFMRLIDSVMR